MEEATDTDMVSVTVEGMAETWDKPFTVSCNAFGCLACRADFDTAVR